MPQYNSSKKHLVLVSQHGISFLLARSKGFSPARRGPLRGVPAPPPCPWQATSSRAAGHVWVPIAPLLGTNTDDGPSRAFCRGRKGGSVLPWVWNIFGLIPVPSVPPSLFWASRPQISRLGVDGGWDQSKSRPSPVPTPLLILLRLLQFRPHWCSWAGS